MVELSDQLNRPLKLSEIPKRIISLVPSQTELLYDLGLEDSIVGLTKFCVHPDHLRKTKKVVGGTKQIHIDKIKALNPDIILCNKEENTKAIVEECETVAVVHVSDIFTIEDSYELIKQYGLMFNCQAQAQSINNSIKTEFEKFNDFIEDKPWLKVSYAIWYRPWMVAAKNTFINYLLRLNKFENIHDDLTRYPEIQMTREYLESLDLMLLSSEPFPFKEEHKEELEAYATNAKILLVDGEYFSWYGSRLQNAFKYFKTLRNSLTPISG